MELNSQNSESTKISFFEENDDFEFKPLSEGLGFHHEEKMKVAGVKHTGKITKSFSNTSQPDQIRTLSPSSTFIQSDLALFYENKNDVNLNSLQDTEVVPTIEALKTTRFAAYIFDFSLVSAVTFTTMAIVSRFTGINFNYQLSILEEMSLISVGFIFISYYFVYFTLLEKMQGKSFGMDLFGIKMLGKKELSIIDIFLFELIVLLGFLSLGMTNFSNLPQLICGIKIIEKK